MSAFYSQAGQDEWVLTMLPIINGTFVDVGAYDGIQTSNTYALELLGWRGVCIEAHPQVFESLKANRISTNIHAAATGGARQVRFEGDRVVKAGGTPVRGATLTALLDEAKCPRHINYLSIDIEGLELEVLTAFDFDRYVVDLMTVEHNLYVEGPGPKEAIYELLSRHGFVRVVEDAPCLDPNPLYFQQPYEDWYARAGFLAVPPGADD